MTVNLDKLRQAALQLGHVEPISIEPDGTIWLGLDTDRTYLTPAQQAVVVNKANDNIAVATENRNTAVAKLKVLGLTDAEVTALIGG